MREPSCRPLAGTGLTARYQSHRLQAVVSHFLGQPSADHRSTTDTFESIYVINETCPSQGSAVPSSSASRICSSCSSSANLAQRRSGAPLLDSRAGRSDGTIARHHHVSRSTVVACIQKFLQFGLEAALGDLPRSGKPRQLPDDAIVQHCACQKRKELGYSYQLWTYRLLLTHIRQRCVAAGHPALLRLSRSKLHKILRQGQLRPHQIRY